MSLITVSALLVAGIVAGFINTLAGGGSLLTIPVLIFAGLPSPVANATNRVAIFMSCATASGQFYHKKQLDIGEGIRTGIPGLFGAVAGAFLASVLGRQVFDKVLAAVLILVLLTMFLKPRVATKENPKSVSPWLQIPAFFFIGVYGGFIQAGVGFLLITAITWVIGHDLVKTNALKMFITLLFATLSLAVFAFYGKIVWSYGFVLGLGNVAGAWLGVHFAIKRGAEAIRWVVVAAVVASALHLLGVF